MSAAHQLAPKEQIQIGGTTAAPVSRPSARPAPRKRSRVVALLAMGSIWMAVMVLSFTLVQKNAAIRATVGETTRMTEQIERLEQGNLELEGKIANAVSVTEVERWAKANNMKPPSGVVQTLQGKEQAVAVRDLRTQNQVKAEMVQENQSLWQALLARFSRSTDQAAGAVR